MIPHCNVQSRSALVAQQILCPCGQPPVGASTHEAIGPTPRGTRIHGYVSVSCVESWGEGRICGQQEACPWMRM